MKVPEEETAIEKARRLTAERARLQRQNSTQALQAARAELDVLESVLRETAAEAGKIAGFDTSVERGQGRDAVAVCFGTVSATFLWKQRFTDSPRDAALLVKEWPFAHRFSGGMMQFTPEETRGETYRLVLNDSDEWVWTQGAASSGVSSAKLADIIVGRLVDTMFHPEDNEPSFVSW